MSDVHRTADPVILPWPEMQKKAERDGVDIMDYVNSMHAHVLNQRDEINRLKDQRAAYRSLAGIGLSGTDEADELARLPALERDREAYKRVQDRGLASMKAAADAARGSAADVPAEVPHIMAAIERSDKA